MRGDLLQLPCCLYSYDSLEEEARMFIVANRARKAMNRLDDFHAAIAAGDEDALEIRALLNDAGLSVARDTSSGATTPGAVMFTAALTSALRKHGAPIVSAALTNIAEAFPNQRLTSGGAIFSALVSIFAHPPAEFDPDELVPALRTFDVAGWGDFVAGIKGGERRGAAMKSAILEALSGPILAIPGKLTEKREVHFLSRPEIDAILAAPDRTGWLGRRDHMLLLFAIQTGLAGKLRQAGIGGTDKKAPSLSQEQGFFSPFFQDAFKVPAGFQSLAGGQRGLLRFPRLCCPARALRACPGVHPSGLIHADGDGLELLPLLGIPPGLIVLLQSLSVKSGRKVQYGGTVEGHKGPRVLPFCKCDVFLPLASCFGIPLVEVRRIRATQRDPQLRPRKIRTEVRRVLTAEGFSASRMFLDMLHEPSHSSFLVPMPCTLAGTETAEIRVFLKKSTP
jgi:hypothetical protein|nr:DUF6551 family protein [Sphingobium fuliginis]